MTNGWHKKAQQMIEHPPHKNIPNNLINLSSEEIIDLMEDTTSQFSDGDSYTIHVNSSPKKMHDYHAHIGEVEATCAQDYHVGAKNHEMCVWPVHRITNEKITLNKGHLLNKPCPPKQGKIATLWPNEIEKFREGTLLPPVPSAWPSSTQEKVVKLSDKMRNMAQDDIINPSCSENNMVSTSCIPSSS